MKVDKVYVLLEDDIEVLGNGQGHVFYRQYLPVKQYTALLKKHGIKSTFYVDMAHYLFLKRNVGKKDFGLQASYIEKTILHILNSEMEVQLHLHSQWVNAQLENNEIKVTNDWNIGMLSTAEQKHLVEEAIASLKRIIEMSGKSNPITSFRTGSWGMQPFATLYDLFLRLGIRTVMGPVKGLKIPKLGIDYTNMNTDKEPYYCEKTDVNKIGKEKDVIVLPMTPTYLTVIDLIRYVVYLKYGVFLGRYDKQLDLNNTVLSTKYDDPTAGKDVLNFSFKVFKTHLKMNTQPFWYLKKTFHRSYKAILKSDENFKLIIIETHSKDFKNTFKDIDRFFHHITTAYNNIEFITANELLNLVNENKLKPLQK